ncbi:MAG: Crp/Fnr family transcriptional regulator [Hamadaea sp.]|nr:Crp/Fnr family transcriptional regulator [Hamadaea sp.]
MDADVRAAVMRSHLHELPPEVLDALVAGAVRTKIPAGAVTHREGDPAPHLELVISGVVRAFVTAPDGRTMTVRYCRLGALIGAVSLFATRFTMPTATQALVDAELLKMSPEVIRHEVARDVRVAQAFLGELSERVVSFIEEIPGNTFATMRQRVARHLLDLAVQRGPGRVAGAEIVVPISQRELADAVGTVREVVVRVLRELRGEGVVRTERDQIVILDPARLVPG